MNGVHGLPRDPLRTLIAAAALLAASPCDADTGTRVTNEPFCYTTNHSVTIKARLEASGFITSAVVRASCSGAKGSLSNVLETNVVFVGGVSSPEYVTFTLKDKTLSKIDCSRGGVFRWSASKVNGIAGSSCMMNETGPLKPNWFFLLGKRRGHEESIIQNCYGDGLLLFRVDDICFASA